MNWLKQLTAAALLALTLTASAYAVVGIQTYQHMANTTLQNAFAYTSTAYDTVTGAANNTCYRVEFFDPINPTPVATHDLTGSGGSGNADRMDSFMVPYCSRGMWTA